jgi:predicted acylesterase/phospholipase RssA
MAVSEYASSALERYDERERIVTALKRTSLFRHVSARLLGDLAARYVRTVPPDGLADVDPAVLMVLDEPVNLEVGTTGAVVAAGEASDAGASAGAATPAPMRLRLDAGLYLRGHGVLATVADWTGARVRPVRPGSTRIFLIPLGDVYQARLPRALWSTLDLDDPLDAAVWEGDHPAPWLVWMAWDAGDGARRTAFPMLSWLLAEAVAENLQHPVALVTLRNEAPPTVERWDPTAKCFRPQTQPALAPPIDAAQLHDLIRHDTTDPKVVRRSRVFVVHEDDPLGVPPPAHPTCGLVPGTTFDQAVWMTTQQPTAIPPSLRALLHAEIQGNAAVQVQAKAQAYAAAAPPPAFYSVVPGVLVRPRPAPTSWARLVGMGAAPFGTESEPTRRCVDSEGAEGEKARLARDTVRLPLCLEALEGRWRRRDRTQPFLGQCEPKVRAVIDRWERAVTNRQVGIAVSGGGAAAYRLAGLIKRLEKTGVPVDVVAGLSGGALIGAYYCTQGVAGLERAIGNGRRFQVLLPLAMVSTWVIEKLVDYDLDSTRIDETQARYVAVTAELPRGKPPRSCVITQGTVGEAVRASGTLPPVFGPTAKNGARYADGGAATLVPAEIARCCGADLTVSYNVIGTPSDGEPLDRWPLGIGRLLGCVPFVGRLADVFVWYGFLMARASEQFGRSADVSIEFRSADQSMLEPLYWYRAQAIADAAYNDPEVIAKAKEVLARWQQL